MYQQQSSSKVYIDGKWKYIVKDISNILSQVKYLVQAIRKYKRNWSDESDQDR